MNLICRLLGHRWRSVYDPRPHQKATPMVTCLRCHENGWMLPSE